MVSFVARGCYLWMWPTLPDGLSDLQTCRITLTLRQKPLAEATVTLVPHPNEPEKEGLQAASVMSMDGSYRLSRESIKVFPRGSTKLLSPKIFMRSIKQKPTEFEVNMKKVLIPTRVLQKSKFAKRRQKLFHLSTRIMPNLKRLHLRSKSLKEESISFPLIFLNHSASINSTVLLIMIIVVLLSIFCINEKRQNWLRLSPEYA